MTTIHTPVTKITPFLWFDNNCEEAMNLYCSIFKNSKPGNVVKSPDGKVFSVTFNLEGQEFYCLNGGPHYKLSPAFSLFVTVESQKEVDEYWNKLIADGGKESRCGWLVDKFGLSWQIIPKLLGELLGHPDREKANRATQAMLKMSKIDCKLLQDAFDGK